MTIADFRLIAPPPTPFHRDRSLNLDAVESLAQWYAASGVVGAFVAGSTGEGQSLTNDERTHLAERWVAVSGAHNLDVIVQVGHNSQFEAQSLAAHAQRIGADAIAASAPCYFKPESVSDLIEFLAPIAAAAGDLPFYFYDIPGVTEVRLPMLQFLEQGKQRMPNLVGLKYSNPDLMQLQQCVQLHDGEFEILYGSDQTLIAGALLGAVGAVGTTYNFAAPFYLQMIAALAAGELEKARKMQAESEYMIRRAISHGGLSAFKALMKLRGVDCGPTRAPVANLPAASEAALLEEIGRLPMLGPQYTPSQKPGVSV